MKTAWILILGTLAVSGCYDREGDVAELVFRGGAVWTGAPGAALAEAVAVTDGRVIAVSANGKTVFRVVSGSFPSIPAANTRAAALKKGGFSTFVRGLSQ